MDTKKIVQQVIPKFYDYIVAAELSENQNTPLIIVGNNQEYLYFHNNPNNRDSPMYEAIILDKIDAEFFKHQNAAAGT